MHNRQQLITAINDEGLKPKYLFFWGHTPSPTGEVTKSCLSQWYESPFTVDGLHYLTAEHYMMAQKAQLFNDKDSVAKILACQYPSEAKKLGRMVKSFNSQTWEQHCFGIVVQGNIAKFSQNLALKEFLLATGKRVLVEASPSDSIWGIGLAQDHAHAKQPHLWQGQNLLGFSLMKVREQLNVNSL
jgi:ribA/ribD-fused uncharacterized protein